MTRHSARHGKPHGTGSSRFAALIIVELTSEIATDARALLLRHRLRAGDAVQLASCLYLQREMNQPLPFVASDDRLTEAARHEGLTVVSVSKGRSGRT